MKTEPYERLFLVFGKFKQAEDNPANIQFLECAWDAFKKIYRGVLLQYESPDSIRLLGGNMIKNV